MRNGIRSKYQNTDDQDAQVKQQRRLCAFQAFNPRQEPHRTKTNEQVFFI